VRLQPRLDLGALLGVVLAFRRLLGERARARVVAVRIPQRTRDRESAGGELVAIGVGALRELDGQTALGDRQRGGGMAEREVDLGGLDLAAGESRVVLADLLEDRDVLLVPTSARRSGPGRQVFRDVACAPAVSAASGPWARSRIAGAR
jgi:hypothetical protein